MGLPRHDEVVLLLGAPGAGKGTQARFLAERLGVPHVASGELLRDHSQRGTPLGLQAQQYMDRGDLVPDAVVVDMIMDRLGQPDAVHGVLLDGFPRTVAQAEALEDRLIARGGGVRTAVYVDVPAEVLIERLAGRWLCATCQAAYQAAFSPPRRPGVCDACGGALYQRSDDQREVVANRVSVYLRDTLPVVKRYEARGLLRRVNGDQSIAAVNGDILRAVGRDEAAIPA